MKNTTDKERYKDLREHSLRILQEKADELYPKFLEALEDYEIEIKGSPNEHLSSTSFLVGMMKSFMITCTGMAAIMQKDIDTLVASLNKYPSDKDPS